MPATLPSALLPPPAAATHTRLDQYGLASYRSWGRTRDPRILVRPLPRRPLPWLTRVS